MRIIYLFGLTIFSIIFMASPQKSELANSSWKGILNVPDPVDANLKFSIDSFYVLVNIKIIETSTYTVSNDTLTLKKVLGGSPCMDEIGVYTYTITNDVLSIRPVSDACDGRKYAFTLLGYKKEN